eukprot:8672040-Karenia_brevis.AAC.1
MLTECKWADVARRLFCSAEAGASKTCVPQAPGLHLRNRVDYIAVRDAFAQVRCGKTCFSRCDGELPDWIPCPDEEPLRGLTPIENGGRGNCGWE